MTISVPSSRIALPAADAFDDCAYAAGKTDIAPSCSAKIPLAETLKRFEREATHGSFDTGRYRMRFNVWGEGPPLVMVPGMCDDRVSFVLPMSRLAERFCCISYDHPTGHDDGAKLGARRHVDYVDDFFALLDHLRLDRVVPMGSSFGSTITLAAMHRMPKRFPRGILQGGFARRRLSVAEQMLARWARWWPGMLAQLPGRESIVLRNQGTTFDEAPPERMAWFLERNGAPPIAAVAHRALVIDGLDLRRLLPSVRQPMLLVVGDSDTLVGRQQEKELLDGLPHANHAEIEHCGHLPQYSHPEVFAELIQQWLSK
ncbi:MAG: alpha/beta hydrolase [Gemmataceae bacterium]